MRRTVGGEVGKLAGVDARSGETDGAGTVASTTVRTQFCAGVTEVGVPAKTGAGGPTQQVAEAAPIAAASVGQQPWSFASVGTAHGQIPSAPARSTTPTIPAAVLPGGRMAL